MLHLLSATRSLVRPASRYPSQESVRIAAHFHVSSLSVGEQHSRCCPPGAFWSSQRNRPRPRNASPGPPPRCPLGRLTDNVVTSLGWAASPQRPSPCPIQHRQAEDSVRQLNRAGPTTLLARWNYDRKKALSQTRQGHCDTRWSAQGWQHHCSWTPKGRFPTPASYR